MKQRYFLLLLLICSAEFGAAQASVLDNTTSWTSYSQKDLYSGQILSDTFQISINKTSIKLKQGQDEISFVIEDLSGNWDDLSEAGKLTFEMPVKIVRGNGIFQRSAGQITLTLDFSVRPQGLKRRYTLTASE